MSSRKLSLAAVSQIVAAAVFFGVAGAQEIAKQGSFNLGFCDDAVYLRSNGRRGINRLHLVHPACSSPVLHRPYR
jgi:hypothetical protein